MSVSPTKNSATRYSLIVFLILTLFLCAIFFYIRNNEGRKLTQDIQQLAEISEDYAQDTLHCGIVQCR